MGLPTTTTYNQFLGTCMERMMHPILPVEVNTGPIKEVIKREGDVDINALPFPLSIILLAIPFTHSMLATNVAFTGDYVGAIGGIIYMAIFTVVVLYIASRLFGTEKILTAKLRFQRRIKIIPRD